MRMVYCAMAALAIALAPHATAQQMTLNKVWSRMADMNGELGSVESAEFDPSGTRIATGSKFDNTVRIFRVSDGFEMLTKTLEQEIERVSWTGDGQNVISVSEDGLMRVIDAETGEVIASHQHDNGIDGLTVSHDGRFIVTGQEKTDDGMGAVRIFDGRDFSLIRTIPFEGTVNEVDFTLDDTRLSAVGDHKAKIYDATSWEEVYDWDLPRDTEIFGSSFTFINGQFSPDGRYLAAGGSRGAVFFFDLESGERVRSVHKTNIKTETVAWTADGAYLLVAGNGMTIDVFRLADVLNRDIARDRIPYALQIPVTDALEYMDFNDDGTLLTTAHQDGTVQLWTFMSGDPMINTREHKRVKAEQAEKNTAEGRPRS